MRVNWKNAFAIKEDVPVEDREFIQKWADAVIDRGLAPPAIVLLEMAKPFSWLLMNIAVGVQPLIRPFWGAQRTERLGRFFHNRQNLEYLIRLLEEGNKSNAR